MVDDIGVHMRKRRIGSLEVAIVGAGCWANNHG